MNKKKEIVPKLRFLKHKSKWIIDSFNFDFLQTNSFSRAEMDDEKGSVKNIHYGDILTKYNDILRDISVVPFVNKDMDLSKFHKECYLKNGDIVITDTAEDFTTGKAVEVLNIDFPVLAGQHTFLCRPKRSFAPGYMGYYLNSPSYHNRLIPLLNGTKVYSISKANIKKTFVLYPEKYEEQQMIADCLSSIDELIDAESRKLEALKKYKKGLMQKLFPAKGKILPEWRFPEFKECGEWEACTVDDSFYTIMPPKKLVKSEYKTAGKYPIIDQSKEYIAGWTDDKESVVSHQRPLIIFGDHTCVLKFVSQSFAQGADGIKILLVNQKLDEKFAYYCLENISLNCDGYKRHYSLLKEFIIRFPNKASGEQRKIADCLSEIDTMIAEQSNKVEQLKTHKKGLMQGLFPSIEEADV